MKAIRLIGAAVALLALAACSTGGEVDGAPGAAGGNRPVDGKLPGDGGM